ncbi:hypothetical protein JTB14_017568 [Gonioctena quinquepunctata]|nr:hypothetical protein JTB14_017568 [Gonioctena quinquepunctata]
MIGRKDSEEDEEEKQKTSEKSKLSKSAVSLKSHTSARVLQEKLNYENEEKRQEIEMERAKLGNQLRLLQLEHDFQEEGIRSVEEERHPKTGIRRRLVKHVQGSRMGEQLGGERKHSE